MIARPTKTIVYSIGGFAFESKADAEFLYGQMKRAARIESALYVKAVEDHEEFTTETFGEFFAERLLAHWQKNLQMEDKGYREVVARMRALVNG